MGAKGRESVATSLVKLARESAELFHFGESCFATIVVGDHRETYSLRGRSFRSWLGHLYFEEEDRAASGEALATATATLEGYARFQSTERRVSVRLGNYEERIYLDLANERWQSVEVSSDGWRVIESTECPIRFVRMHGMLPLATPTRGGRIDALRPFLNVASECDFQLLIAYLLGAFHPRGPYPILILHGEQGSAKTTTARILRGLIDPNLAPARSTPREARDLMIAASNSWILSFDNISGVPHWLSDDLCRLSTGGGFGIRTLYTDDEERIFQATRPVILNGIEEIAARGDLLDRSILVYLPRIPDEHRREEKSFDAAYHLAHPGILGALLDAASSALGGVSSVKLETLPRMADFAMWVTAAEPALGWAPQTFIGAYSENRRAANDLPLETAVVEAIRKLSVPWVGTASSLLKDLNRLGDEHTQHSKDWPKGPRSLANELRRLAPNLRRTGIGIVFGEREGGTGKRLISISECQGTSSSQTSQSPQIPAGRDSRDDSDDRTRVSSGKTEEQGMIVADI